MATSVNSLQPETKTSPVIALKGHVYTMLAAFAGVVLGVLGSMGFVSNMLQSQFAAQNAALDKRIVATAPASDVNSCYGTSSASGGAGKSADKMAVAAPHEQAGGKGADEQPAGGKGGDAHAPFVNQLISGSISNTGPNSSNSINATNNFNYTAVNNNNVGVTNSNTQTSTSGSSSVSNNTNAGSAQSGNADNHNSESTWVTINN